MSRIIALVYNWWNLFVRLAIPEKHHEAITSRPLLLSSIGRLSEHGRQRKMIITRAHGHIEKLKRAYTRLMSIFNEVKSTAPQLNTLDCWRYFLEKVTETFRGKTEYTQQIGPPLPA